MKIYPIRVPRHPYGGNDPAKRRKKDEYNRDAAKLEAYLNEQISSDPQPIQQYDYGSIASEVDMPMERVADILFGVDAGHNGLTVAKSAEAWKKFMSGPHDD